MDIFDKLIHINKNRAQDSGDEARILSVMRARPSRSGTLRDLEAALPDVHISRLRSAVMLLASRGKVTILSGNRWQLLE